MCKARLALYEGASFADKMEKRLAYVYDELCYFKGKIIKHKALC